MPIEVEIYDTVKVPELKAFDNSGLIRAIYSKNFVPDQIIYRNINATFVAEDFSGNKETCTIEIKTRGKKLIFAVIYFPLIKGLNLDSSFDSES